MKRTPRSSVLNAAGYGKRVNLVFDRKDGRRGQVRREVTSLSLDRDGEGCYGTSGFGHFSRVDEQPRVPHEVANDVGTAGIS